MQPKKKVPNTIAVLKLARPAQAASAYAKTILAGLGGHPLIFVTPNPPLATFKADIDALDAAETLALGRTKGAVEDRNAKLAVVVSDIHVARTYVNQLAAVDSANAAAIITAAGFALRKPTVQHKQLLAAKQGPAPGVVVLSAKAVAPKASYDWQWSLDQKTWVDVPSTLVARTSVAGLSAAVIHYFRFRARTRAGQGDWSDVVTLIVH